jgi:TonB family protein
MRKRSRQLAVLGFFAFILVSAVAHFATGSAVATFFPSWRYYKPPEQAISIISLSRNVRQEATPKPTPPPPLPKPIFRTSTHLATLHYRELTRRQVLAIRSIRPPARRVSDLHVLGPKFVKPDTNEAPGVTNAAQQTPAPGVAGAKVDTGGANNEINGATVWGDDNPVRVVKLANLAQAITPARSARIEVEVDPDGKVTDVRLIQSSGDANFDAMALDAARSSVFAPATLNGLPVHGSIVLEYPPPSAAS